MKPRPNAARAAIAGGLLLFLPFEAPSTVLAAASISPFQVSSPELADGAVIPQKYSGNFNGCSGQNRSPPLAWVNAPLLTKSFAVVLFDVDGAKGLGVTHWIVYGIPPTTNALAENAGDSSGTTYVGGVNMRHTLAYAGPCPRPGDDFHHYLYFVYALDLPPHALAPGLDYPALKSAMDGHILAAASLSGRFARPAAP
jgi:Raf kinase inhibitor-like YbhB/YbcL family protein